MGWGIYCGFMTKGCATLNNVNSAEYLFAKSTAKLRARYDGSDPSIGTSIFVNKNHPQTGLFIHSYKLAHYQIFRIKFW